MSSKSSSLNVIDHIEASEEPFECPICMDDIDITNNYVITECGHKFHSKCLIQNVAYNGFDCPNCRSIMAEEPEGESDDDSDDEYDNLDEHIVEQEVTVATQPENIDDCIMGNFRWVFANAELQESMINITRQEERYLEQFPSVEYLMGRLIRSDITMLDLMKYILSLDHDEYSFVTEYDNVAERIYSEIRHHIDDYDVRDTISDFEEEEHDNNTKDDNDNIENTNIIESNHYTKKCSSNDNIRLVDDITEILDCRVY